MSHGWGDLSTTCRWLCPEESCTALQQLPMVQLCTQVAQLCCRGPFRGSATRVQTGYKHSQV